MSVLFKHWTNVFIANAPICCLYKGHTLMLWLTVAHSNAIFRLEFFAMLIPDRI